MADIPNTENNDTSPLLKIKKPRPPPSIKQMENFKKAAAKRAENILLRKNEKLFAAQKALLEKEGILQKQKLKEKPSIQFEIKEDSESEQESESEPEPIKQVKQVKQVKEIKQKKETVAKPIKKKEIPLPELIQDSSDYSSDSSEEIIVIKRSKKKSKGVAKASKNKPAKQIYESEEELEAPQEYVAQNFKDFFC
jgi:hypothetical protein